MEISRMALAILETATRTIPAKNNIIDFVGIQARTLQDGFDHLGAQLGCREVLQRAAKTPDRGP